MAQIPMGEFGAPRVAPRSGVSRVDNSGTEAVGRALQQAGQQGMQTASQFAQASDQRIGAENAKAEQEAEALARAKAVNATNAYQLQVQQALDDEAGALGAGADYTTAGDRLSAAVAKIEVPTIEGLSPALLETYNGAIANTREGGKLKLGGLVKAARRDDGQRQFATLLDDTGKAAALPGANVPALLAQVRASVQTYRELGLDGSTLDKAVQDFSDKTWTNEAAARFNAAQNDVEGLRTLQAELVAGKGGYAGKLDPEKRNAMARSVGNQIDTLEAKTERKADKLDTLVNRTLEQIDAQTSLGIPATIEQRANWADVYQQARPEQRAEFEDRMAAEAETQKLLRLPITEQVAALTAREAAMRTQGGDSRDVANFNRLRAAVEGNVKLLQDSPLQFAVSREGEQVPPLDLAALANPATAGQAGLVLESRALLVRGLQKQYGGQVPTKLLLPQEQAALVAGLAAMTVKDRVATFGQLRGVAGGDKNYLAVMQQLAPDAPVTALAGMLHVKNPKAASLVMQGETLMQGGDIDGKLKPVKLPAPAEFDLALSDAVGTAFRDRPEAYAVALQAVRAGYAGAAATDGDVSGAFNENRLKNIITAVLGETVDINDRGAVFTPYGMDPDAFEDKLEAAFAGATLHPSMPRDLDLYGLQQVGDGRYYLTAGRHFVPGADGRPYVIEIAR